MPGDDDALLEELKLLKRGITTDAGLNDEIALLPVALREHDGPGPHKSGSPQSVHRKGGAVPQGRKQFVDSEKTVAILKYRGEQYAVVKKNKRGGFTVEDRGLSREDALAYAGELAGAGSIPRPPAPPKVRVPKPAPEPATAGADGWTDATDLEDAKERARALGAKLYIDGPTAEAYPRGTLAAVNAIGRAIQGGHAPPCPGGYMIAAGPARHLGSYDPLLKWMNLHPAEIEPMIDRPMESPSRPGEAWSTMRMSEPGDRTLALLVHESGHMLDDTDHANRNRGMLTALVDRQITPSQVAKHMTEYGRTDLDEYVAESYVIARLMKGKVPDETWRRAVAATKHLGKPWAR